MVGWYHQLDGHEFEYGDSYGFQQIEVRADGDAV